MGDKPINNHQLIVVTSGSYPYGGAATNRHMSYLKGLSELGINVNMCIIQQSNNQSDLSHIRIGDFDGVNFEYSLWNPNKNGNKVIKVIQKLRSVLITIKKVKYQFKNSDKKTVLLVLLTSSLEIFPFLFLSKLYKIPVFHERTEYPFIGKKGIGRIELFFYLNFIIPRFDGIFLITNSLVEYFKKYYRNPQNLIHIPMTVDYTRFKKKMVKIEEFGKYIAYCGSMYSDKDGVPDLIKAFNIFSKKINDYNLILIGENSNKEKFKFIQDIIDETSYKSRIFCIGNIERDLIPDYLSNAEILALARPNNIQAQGGFPTKLGEYLMTENPVVVTDVGEISNYLSDEFSAYIAKPSDPESFAQKLIKAVNMPEKSKQIGVEGKNVALQYFNYQRQSRMLAKFIFNLTTDEN